MKEVLSRILAKVEFEPNTGCWLWTGALTQRGYGQWVLYAGGKSKNYRVHRLSYELHKGEVPPDMFVCHRCDTPACLNPAHLFLGTPLDNVRDMDAKGRRPYKGVRKLSDAAVAHILRRELMAAQYAALYGVSCGHIGNIWTGRRSRPRGSRATVVAT